MASLVNFKLVAVAVLALAFASTVAACNFSCPSGFTAVADGSLQCRYTCIRPYNYACPGRLALPIQCGGSTGTNCPFVGCVKAYASAYAGPNGCASAAAQISATATIGNTVTASSSLTFVNEADICGPHSPLASTSIRASLAATAYAEAISTTTIQFSEHVCTCCSGNSKAYALVQGGLKVSASSYASAFASGLASLSCYGELLAGASQVVESVAASTQTAINTVYAALASSSTGGCTTTGVQTQVKRAVARSVACAFLQVFAAYDVKNDVSSALSCGATVALSGPEWDLSNCAITYCPKK